MSNQQNNAQSPRHWHGSIGDRYEHHNVWVRGGPAQAYMAQRPAPTETANAMSDRRESTSSSMSSGSQSPPTAPNRRSSQGGGLFEGLTNQKRNSTDPMSAARRASYNDQAQQGGFFSKWWDGYTRGTK
ncbi:hypothetical protein BDV25DRAFT_28902 [Aspergillus avenaceus]|uniref:Uncharacterized protein n=1 Tax=Aspergillus avenaceus TaxID=36643 RepID=A0A5N6TMW1_ASPAV|nr:hypothetical protein BDV25DRAFT_28902 [Aspergillus avenaceus]